MPVVIDCDTGRDDALALWCLRDTDMELAAAVSSYGNVSQTQVHKNTQRVLAFGGFDVPVFHGASEASQKHRLTKSMVTPRQLSIGNGLCNLLLPEVIQSPEPKAHLVDQLSSIAAIHGPIDYCILGPATSFAQLAPQLIESSPYAIRSITMMGGRLEKLWEDTPEPDFNIACDPFAVQGLLDLNLDIRFVSLNTTWDMALHLSQIETLTPQSALADFAKELMMKQCREFSAESVFRFHDPAVIFALNHSDFFKPTKLQVNTDENSPLFGQITVHNHQPPNAFLFATDESVKQTALSWILKQLDLELVLHPLITHHQNV